MAARNHERKRVSPAAASAGCGRIASGPDWRPCPPPRPPSRLAAVAPIGLALATALALVCTAGAASAVAPVSPSPETILRRALHAAYTTGIHGREQVMVTPPGVKSTTILREVICTTRGCTLLRWLEPASQSGQLVMDDGHRTLTWMRGDRTVNARRSVPEPRSLAEAARMTRLVLANYHVALKEREPLAGRECYVLELRPLDPTSHRLTFWIDTRTYCVLGHKEDTARGDTVLLSMYRWVTYTTAYTEAQLRHAFSRRLPISTDCTSRVFADLAALRRTAPFPVWVPCAMPAGYELTRCELLQAGRQRLSCLWYTDGLQNITIFQGPARASRPSDLRLTRMRRTRDGENIVDCSIGPMDFMLIGRIEPHGLMLAARALNEENERAMLDNIAHTFNVPRSTLAYMRNQGIGIDTIDALVEIGAVTRRPVGELVSMWRQGYRWREIAHIVRADAAHFVARVHLFQAR